MPKPIDTDLTGRVCLVTGANTGIGKLVALGLARLGAHVVLACRSRERGQAALAEISARTRSGRLELELVDLSRRDSIVAFAESVRERHPRLDVLVNNAGVWSNTRRLSADGVELTLGTNVFAYVLATELLLEPLRAAAGSRIVNVASELASDLDLDDLEFQRRPYSGTAAYAQSKQANRMLTRVLAARLEGTGVVANACHPGMVSTELARDFAGPLGPVVRGFFRLAGRSPEQGADTPTWLAASPEVEGASGKFFVDRRERPCRFQDDEANRALDALVRRRLRLD